MTYIQTHPRTRTHTHLHKTCASQDLHASRFETELKKCVCVCVCVSCAVCVRCRRVMTWKFIKGSTSVMKNVLATALEAIGTLK